jgi:hypothetical protein
MSGGGAAVPKAPDLSGNVSNANQTFSTATADAAQQMEAAKAYNAQAQKQLDTTLGTSNQMAGLISGNAAGNISSYQQNFQPLQALQAQQAQQYGSEQNIARLQGQAVAGVNAANQAARQNSAAALAAEGVDPSSIKGGALDRAAGVMGAANAAGAGTAASIGAQQRAFEMANQTNQLGLGVGAQGTAGGATAAQVAQGAQGITNATGAQGISNLGASNQYLQTGTSANKSAADISSQAFQNQMAQNQAEQAQQGSTGQLIGQVAGIAAMAMMEDGGPVVLDRGIPVMAAGGQVMQTGALPSSPIPGSTDTKPALLTPGEFVIPKDVVDFKGADHFHKLIDSVRNQRNKRMAIPIHHPPHVTRQ